MEFYVGQKLKFKDDWADEYEYGKDEVIVVIGIDDDGDPELFGSKGKDYFYKDTLADIVDDVT